MHFDGSLLFLFENRTRRGEAVNGRAKRGKKKKKKQPLNGG